MTDSAVPATTDRIADVLASHYRLIRGSNIARQECICGEWSITNRSVILAEERHREHIATVLREAVADELSDGFDKDNAEAVLTDFSDDYNDGYVYAMELADRIVRVRP